jgi:hypothetical protein
MGATDEQEATDLVAKFLVREVGWAVTDNLADTASDRHIVLSSSGEDEVENNNTIYIELRGNSNAISLATYETYTDSVTYTGKVSDATYGKITCVGSVVVTCVADRERAIIHLREDGGNQYVGYVGRISSYYKSSEHPYPHLVKGMSATTYNFFYVAADRNMWMLRADGAVSPYYPLRVVGTSEHPAMGSAARTNTNMLAAIPVYYSGDASYYEVAGELRGIFSTDGLKLGNTNYVVVDENIYIYMTVADTVSAYVVGPVADGTAIPSEVPAIDWDTALT